MAQNYGNYGKLGGRRRGTGALQWILIGFFPGILCGGIFIFGLMLTNVFDGVLSLNQPTPTPGEQTVLVVTATQDPNRAQPTPIVITATSEPTQAVAAPVIVGASPTPTVDLRLQATQVAQSGSGVEGNIAPSVPQPTIQVAGPSINPTNPTNPTTPNTNTGGVNTGSGVGNPALQNLQALATNLVPIPGATFTMGTTAIEVLDAVDQCIERDGGSCQPAYGEDSTPQFEVQLSPYQMETTEVTFQQYVAFLNYLSSTGRNHLTGCQGRLCIQTRNEDTTSGVITFDSVNYSVASTLNDYPVYAVTWYGAQAYCDALGRRLPTEAEWEFAARGTTGRVYPWGDQWSVQLAQTNRSPGEAGPVPVASFPNGSPFGLLDMSGNVAEWVQDWYDIQIYKQYANQPQPISNPTGPTVALEKTVRGGSWDAVPFFARTMHRQHSFLEPEDVSLTFERWIGFRCAANPDAGQANAQPIGGVDPNTLGASVPDTTTGAGAQPTIPVPPEAGQSTNTSDRG